MSEDGRAFGLEAQGFRNLNAVRGNLSAPALYEEAVRRGEGHVAKNGPLVVLTGVHTGRSANDKFVVRDEASENNVWWDNNKPMSPAHFDALYADMMHFAEGRELFAHPRMPYTQMLLHAVPDLSMTGKELAPMKGEIPSPIDPPPGCAFNPRCPRRFDRCLVERPELMPAGASRAACWLHAAT